MAQGREKAQLIMRTNIKGPYEERKILIRKQAKFTGFIQLWEQLFDLDLYAYKLRFIDSQTKRQISCLMDMGPRKMGDTPPRVELVIEAPGG